MSTEREVYLRVIQGWTFELIQNKPYWKARAQNRKVPLPNDLIFADGRTREGALENVLWEIERRLGAIP